MKLKHWLAAVIVVWFTVSCEGCAPSNGAMQDYMPWIDIGVSAVSTATMAGSDIALERGDMIGCIVAESLHTAAEAALQVIDGYAGGEIVLPQGHLELNRCLDLMGELAPVMSEDVGAKVHKYMTKYMPLLHRIARAAVRASDIRCEHKMLADGLLEYFKGLEGPVLHAIVNTSPVVEWPGVTVAKCD